jgi:two-component system, NarL family, invasion response regulator UvrY
LTTKVRVLVVDDDAVTRGVIREALESAGGFDVAGEAATAGEALETSRRNAVDVVVLDHHLPGEGHQASPMQGMELIEYFKQSPSRPVVIVHSSNAQIEGAALRAQADAFISKGETEVLVATIRRLVGQ